MPSSSKKSTSAKRTPALVPPNLVNSLNHLLRAARPSEYREALLEIYHTYITHQHEALPLDFPNIAQRIHLLSEFFKELDQYDPGKLKEKN
jgi:hypothetical protein